jgi:hypothetical protein
MNTNLSLAEVLAEAHERLHREIEGLLAAAHSPVEFHQRLVAAQNHVRDHFHFEEFDGYLDHVLDRCPHLERSVQRLKEEHVQLSCSLEALLAEAAVSTSLDETFCAKVRAWIAQLQAHEDRENKIVGIAFSQEAGTGD